MQFCMCGCLINIHRKLSGVYNSTFDDTDVQYLHECIVAIIHCTENYENSAHVNLT